MTRNFKEIFSKRLILTQAFVLICGLLIYLGLEFNDSQKQESVLKNQAQVLTERFNRELPQKLQSIEALSKKI